MTIRQSLAALLTDEDRLTRIARLWLILAVPLLAFHFGRQLQVGLSDGAGGPLGEDFINFWSGARLALTGHWPTVYDIPAFHAFENQVIGAEIGLYHYSYPPVTWLLTAPFAALPYLAGLILWQVGGWAAFALALRRIVPGHWLLFALASPAVFINAIGGQNGCWTAAALGWGMILLRERPLLAGTILAVFVVKPQLGWLIPVALLAGRHYRALAAFIAVSLLLVAASVAAFGVEAWVGYLRQGQLLKTVILEDGFGTWHRMISLFILSHHAGASIAASYVVQAIGAAVAAVLVARQWWREGGSERSFAVLLFAILAGALYVSDYDCVMVSLAAAWLWPKASPPLRAALAAAIVLPMLAASVAVTTGLALGAVVLWWPLIEATRRERPVVTPEGFANSLTQPA